jgi:uncharacterized membrane protein YfcA
VNHSIAFDAAVLGIGVASGVLSAAFGVGGAALSTPAIRALGVPPLLAVGTTLPSVIPSAIVGSWRYSRARLVDWPIVWRAVPAGVVAAVGGSLLSRVIPGGGHWLMVATAVILGWMAARIAWPDGVLRSVARNRVTVPSRSATTPGATASESLPAHTRARPAVLAGVGAGLLSGLLGLGGGVILVPVFTQWLRLPLHRAVATSLACVGLLAVPSTITHAIVGDIDWTVALLLTVGVLPGARLGAGLAIRTSERGLRIAVAVFLGVVSVVYGLGELLALGR